MRAPNLLLAFVLLGSSLGPWAHLASAQTGSITGVIRDRAGKPIQSATVLAEHPQNKRTLTTSTNRSGRFSFVGLDSGTWFFVVRARGFEPTQVFARVRRGGNPRIELTMEYDPLHPPIPLTGVLAGIAADEFSEELNAADKLYEAGHYDQAIAAYQAILARVPSLSTLHLQIGHAYRAKKEYDKALTAYREVLATNPSNAEALAAVRDVEAGKP